MKSRKTPQEERIKIVKYCLEHEKDYKLIATVFDVPYANVYGWGKKYIQKGEEGLSDKRGCHKKDEELDEVSLLKRQLKQMEQEGAKANISQMCSLLAVTRSNYYRWLHFDPAK